MNDGEWKVFFQELGVNKKEAKALAEKIPKIGKYIEFYNKYNSIYKDTKKVSEGLQNFGNVCSTVHMDDAVEAISNIHKTIYK